MITIEEIQQVLRQENIEAWALFDFRRSNNIAWQTLAIPDDAHCTRRWVTIIPQNKTPITIAHRIESFLFDNIPGETIEYSTWTEWQELLKKHLGNYHTVAIEYSPNNNIPVVSCVDAGTVELLRSLGIVPTTSANIVQRLTAVWSQEQMKENLVETAPQLHEIMRNTIDILSKKLSRNETVSEFEIQQFILQCFGEKNLVSDSAPIVAIGKNAASPHYSPTKNKYSFISRGDVIVVDMWAKKNRNNSVYSDITWTLYAGQTPPEYEQSLFSIISSAREAGISAVQNAFRDNIATNGAAIDDAVRNIVIKAGYAQYFIHRTGHSITTETHGPGANIDNYETQDNRPIIAGTSFSIEPGIYIPNEIGMRTEIDIVITHNNDVVVPTNPRQYNLFCLL